MRRPGRPLARAVRMKLALSTSSMEDRVMRAIDAMKEVESAITGITT